MPERILVVGAGSIGRRHATNLLALGADVRVCDADLARAESVDGATAVGMDAIEQHHDGVVVASPSAHHAEQARAALRTGGRVLVEKPLVLDAAEVDDLVAEGGDRLAVAFNLRCHDPIVTLVDAVRSGAVGAPRAVRAWYGQYLPDWRPGTDYRASYSARAALGGGILNDAAHELDLLVWLLGDEIDVVGAVVDRVGPLEMDAENRVAAVLRGGGVTAQLSLDALSRRYRRGLEVVGDDATVRLDWAASELVLEDGNERRDLGPLSEVARSYEVEAERFLAWVRDGSPMPVDGRAGASSVRLADSIRAAATATSTSKTGVLGEACEDDAR